MFRIHRLFIKTAIVYLLLGVLLGGSLLLMRAVRGTLAAYSLITIHTHMIGVGTILNMIMGVAHWMFPREPGVTKEIVARDPLAWWNYLLLNLGLLLRLLFEPLFPALSARVALGVSAFLQVLGVVLFVACIWKRVRAPSTFPQM